MVNLFVGSGIPCGIDSCFIQVSRLNCQKLAGHKWVEVASPIRCVGAIEGGGNCGS